MREQLEGAPVVAIVEFALGPVGDGESTPDKLLGLVEQQLGQPVDLGVGHARDFRRYNRVALQFDVEDVGLESQLGNRLRYVRLLGSLRHGIPLAMSVAIEFTRELRARGGSL